MPRLSDGKLKIVLGTSEIKPGDASVNVLYNHRLVMGIPGNMLYVLTLPTIASQTSIMRIECIFAPPSTMVKTGHKLTDFSVDLGNAFSQDCPPISYYRLVMRENLWLRQWHVVPGDICAAAQACAIFSDDPDEALDGPHTRPVRTASAGIISHPGMWSVSP